MDGEICVRDMRDDDADYAQLTRWRSDARVAHWYGGVRDAPVDATSARARYRPRVLGYVEVVPCIAEAQGAPIGYVQFYPVFDAASYGLDDAEATWGMDLYVGEPARWGTGIGTRIVRLVRDHLFTTEAAQRVVIDPWAENTRAIRSYEKAGFRRVKALPCHELHDGSPRDCVLMLADRPQLDPNAR